MIPIFIDIETLPAVEWSEEQKKAYGMRNHPKRMSKPETIQAWYDKEGKDLWQRTALDPMLGHILCVAVKVAGQEARCIKGSRLHRTVPAWLEGTAAGYSWVERALLVELHAFLQPLLDPPPGSHSDHVVVAHNGYGFDFPWLIKRACILGVPELGALLMPRKRWGTHLLDTQDAWMRLLPGGRGYVSKDALCDAFGIPNDDQITGADVYRCWKDGELELIGHHAKRDVEKLEAIWDRMDGCNMFERYRR